MTIDQVSNNLATLFHVFNTYYLLSWIYLFFIAIIRKPVTCHSWVLIYKFTHSHTLYVPKAEGTHYTCNLEITKTSTGL